MSEFSKYDSLLNDLDAIETQISVLQHKEYELSERNKQLDLEVKELSNKNSILLQKITQLEKGIMNFESSNQELFNSLSSKEKEEIKSKLQSFIKRIEYHLSS